MNILDMKLSEIATISGKPGLFRIFKPTKGGVIIEALDEKKTKSVVASTHKVSILHEVSIYTTDAEGSVLLSLVLKNMYNMYQDALPIEPKADQKALFAFFEQVLPEFDKSKVYHSDIKKLLTWYNILIKYAPAIFEELNKEEENETITDNKEEEKA